MKTRSNHFLLISTVFSFAAATHAADFTWDGGTGNWNATNWNGATAAGPVTTGNTATINSGIVTVNVGGVNTVDSITVATGGQLNLDEDIVYNSYGNIVLQGGILNGVNTGNDGYGVSFLTGLTVSGSAASTIQGNFFNLGATGSPATFSVSDVTGDANPDLNLNTGLWDLPGNSSALIKTGAGTMRMSSVSIYSGGTTVNEGTLELAGASNGFANIKGAVTVNSGATISMTGGDGTGLGWQGYYKVTSLTINGGTVTSDGTAHIWDFSGGVNMTGGTLQSNNGVSDPNGGQLEWNYANVTTNASADTATIGGRIRIRGDGGYSAIAFNVADGTAATDLAVTAAVTEASGGLGITKSGAGTMVLSGNSTYTGATTISAGTLLVTGALGSGVEVSGGAFGGTGTVGGALSIASGFFHVADLSDSLAVSGTINLFSGFGVDDLSGISWGSVADGTYTLISGTLGSGVFANLANNSLATAYNVGGGRSAYFQDGSLQLVVVPEPGAALLGGLGMLALLRRRRA